MAQARYAYCEVLNIRCWMEERLKKLPEYKGKEEKAAEFWQRVERAGLLFEALALYDQVAAEYTAWKQTTRETKQQFAERTGREGRQAEADRLRAELLASGLTQREAQVELVERLQPLDGSETRAWETPDPWEAGRLFKKKEVQNMLLETLFEANEDEYESLEVIVARDRVEWAELRRDERQALVAARRRARTLKQEQERLKQQPAALTKASNDGQPQSVAVLAGRLEDREVI